MFALTGKRALVTGASGGIGAAIARALHAQGATVGLSGTRQEALETLAKSLGERAICLPARLDTVEGPAQLVQAAEKALGGLDILINNAGLTKDGLLMRMKDEDWETVLAVNLTAAFKICREAIRGMLKQRQGRILNISSIVGVTGNPGQANYVASKAGLIGFSKALAAEVATRGITVNCIAPGFITTPMTEGLPQNHQEKLLEKIPLGRMGAPEEIAAAAVYLASDEAAYVTGQTLHVNGGMLMV
jgi:3-oxoacyl-[acyl-carrier protein] reductase